jgi:SAM-dependent methyltransferase
MGNISWTDEKIAKIWNFYSDQLNYCKGNFSYEVGKDVLKWANNFIDFKKITSAMDFGCGPGYFIGYLLEDFNNILVSGCDISSTYITKVNNRYRHYNNFNEVFHINDLSIKCQQNSFDIIFLIEVIEHLDDNNLNSVIDKIYNLLKFNGLLVVTTPNNEDLSSLEVICPECNCIFHPKQHLRSWDKLSLINFLKSKRFVPIRVNEETFMIKEKLVLFDKLKRLYWNYKKRIGTHMEHLAYIGQKY